MKNKNTLIIPFIAGGSLICGFVIGRASKKNPTEKGALIVSNTRQNPEVYLKMYSSLDDICSKDYVIFKIVKMRATDA